MSLLFDLILSGHNGLVAAGYLQRNGINVCVLERRPVVGGAAVTEEIVPSFKFSRASYVLSLLRPKIFQDLELKVSLSELNNFTFTGVNLWDIILILFSVK